MTTQQIPSLAQWRTGPAWAGRSSDFRRRQVARGRNAALAPAASLAQPAEQVAAHPPVAAGLHADVEDLWRSTVDVLVGIDAPATALLSTSSGTPVLSFGLADLDQDVIAQVSGRTFAARGDRRTGEVTTIEHDAGTSQTVIATVPAPGHPHLLLTITAEGVSLPLLAAWTRQAADELREVLASQA